MTRFTCLMLFALGAIACTSPTSGPNNQWLVLDMVHHNPGEALTRTSFNDPQKLAAYGYDGMVNNDFTFIHTAIPFESVSPDIFPKGSRERAWVDSVATVVDARIAACHAAGIKAYYFTDIIVLPTRLKDLFAAEICNEEGKIDFGKPKTREIHRLMLREIFDRFPGLDGLVIRTGETYLHNVPYHTGNNPVLNRSDTLHLKQVHVDLLTLLREEVCVARNKTLIYRTWDFGFFHTEPDIYLDITGRIPTHPQLYFAIKHPKGDYHRTFPFNPTLGIGQHKQIVEVQCQREYEGKGAYPNYVMNGVIEGFEEHAGDTGTTSLRALAASQVFAGVWSWSRGGGWVGPYIQNELWCDLNAYVISAWTREPARSEEEIFLSYATQTLRLSGPDARRFRRLCLLSAKAVVRGHGSLIAPVNVWWTRDQFLGGMAELQPSFDSILVRGLTREVLAEKHHAAAIWDTIYSLAAEIHFPDTATQTHVISSCAYGRLLHHAVAHAWTAMLLGYSREKGLAADPAEITRALKAFDDNWAAYQQLPQQYPGLATLYVPYAFRYVRPHYQDTTGLLTALRRYR